MARQLEVFGIKFKGEGFEQLKGIQKELKALSSSTRLSNAAFANAATQVLAYGKRTKTTTASVKAQLTALKTLRDQVGLTSRAYKGMTGEINKLQQLQKRGFTDKQLLSQIPGAKPRTIKAQIGAALRELEESSITDGSYSNALLEATRRQEKFNNQLKEQSLITKNLFQMDQSRGLTTTRYELPDPKQGSQGIKLLSQKTGIERLFHWLLESPDWTKANRMPDPGEASPYGGYKARRIEEKTAFKYGTPLQLALPQTTNALQFGLKKVQEELGDVTVGSAQYHRVLGQVAEAQHKYNRALSQTTRDLKNATNMRPVSRDLLTARRNLAGSRRVRARTGSGFSEFSQDAEYGIYGDGRAIQKALARRQRDQAKIQGFTKARNNPMAVSGLYDQISSIGMSKVSANIDRMGKSWRTVRKDIVAATKAGNGSLNSLQSQKSAFEQLRAGLDPTSKAFKRLTKDISQVDKQLNKLNNNKFSGANLRRTGQSILGAGFVGGPAGFLGAGLGAGFEALRPGGDMAGGAITGGLLASQVARPVTEFIGGSTTYASDIEKAKIALRGITKDQGSYEAAMAAAAKATELYNVPQEVAIKGMTRLSAAVLGAGGNIHNATEAFLNTTVAIKGTAGSADDVKSAITAMVQIYSKGKVSAEELSGQLGERFPAAVTKFAKANNISTQTLQKNLKDGTVGLDMLSKFVTSLGDEYAPLAEKIAASSEEAGARAQIAMNKLKIAVGTTLKPIGAEFQIISSELLVSLIPALESLAEIAKGVMTPLVAIVKALADNFDLLASSVSLTAGAFAGLAVQRLVGWFAGLVQVLREATKAQWSFNAAVSANKYVIIGTAIAGLILLVKQFGRQYTKTAEEIKEGLFGKTIEAAEDELAEVSKKIKDFKDLLEDDSFFNVRRNLLGDSFIKARLADLAVTENALREYINKEKATKAKHDFDPITGTGGGGPIDKFKEELEKTGEAIQDFYVGTFKKMEDALTNFVMTGKLNFKDFARSVIADITRIAIRQAIIAPIVGTIFPNVKEAKGGVYSNGIRQFAKGGIVDAPTYFPFSKGVGLMGEAGPEAIMPLKRGKGGRLGVESSGGSGTVVNISVDAKGTSVEGQDTQAKMLGKMLSTAVQAEIARQKRPGGILTYI